MDTIEIIKQFKFDNIFLEDKISDYHFGKLNKYIHNDKNICGLFDNPVKIEYQVLEYYKSISGEFIYDVLICQNPQGIIKINIGTDSLLNQSFVCHNILIYLLRNGLLVFPIYKPGNSILLVIGYKAEKRTLWSFLKNKYLEYFRKDNSIRTLGELPLMFEELFLNIRESFYFSKNNYLLVVFTEKNLYIYGDEYNLENSFFQAGRLISLIKDYYKYIEFSVDTNHETYDNFVYIISGEFE